MLCYENKAFSFHFIIDHYGRQPEIFRRTKPAGHSGNDSKGEA
jgi:hypothetical protein